MQETTLTGESMNIVADNIEKLKQIFPDVFCEDKVDFEKLQEVLGSYVEDKQERYNFTWNGKSKALRLSQAPSTGTLRPCIEESKNWDTTENIYIEGDNLEILKLLQKTYHNKIKMIYIDPPYNTGGEFVYPDDYSDNLKNYLEITRQKDSEGNRLSANSETSGRYHTNWINMMYPRLRLARNLLKDDGVIFISIDEHEIDNLRKICNEIFGEDNLIEQLIWKKRATAPNDTVIGRIHEYILCYAKNINYLDLFLQPRDEKSIERYANPDNDIHGPWAASDLSANGKGGRLVESCIFPIKNPIDGAEYLPPQNKCWLYNKEKINDLLMDGRIGFREKTGSPYLKRYLSEVRQGVTLPTIINEGGFSSDSAKEIKILFGADVAEFTKPVKLMKILLTTGLDKNDLILDFFSGSASTAHACMQLNAEDGGNRKFIMAQLQEPCDAKSEAYKAGYKNICEIGKERIRRAGDKIKEEVELGNQQLKLAEEPKKIPDIGFKVLKLDSSNIKKWNPNVDNIEESLQQSLLNFVEGRTELDMVYEIMLKYGIDLTYPIETLDVNDKKVYSIGFGQLMICLDDNITTDIAQAIIEHKKQEEVESMVVVFKDNGFKDDSAKTNIKEILKVSDIKDFVTV